MPDGLFILTLKLLNYQKMKQKCKNGNLESLSKYFP